MLHYLLIIGIFTSTCSKLNLNNIQESTKPQTFESVESIREHAPMWHKMGNRLITESDYKTYILNNYKDRIYDVYVCNNAAYTTTFYQWLQKYGKLNIDIRKYNYRYTDACDFNNIYLWFKPQYNSDVNDSDISIITTDCKQRASATAEIVPCNAIHTYFLPYYSLNKNFNLSEIISEAWTPPVRIFLYKIPNTFVSNNQIKESVNKIFIDYFTLTNQKLGSMINLRRYYPTDY